MAVAGVAFNQRTTSGTTVSATRPFSAGSYGLVVGLTDQNTDVDLTFSGSGLTYNDIAVANVNNGANSDFFNQEAAWFEFVAGGSLTVTSTAASSSGWGGIVLVEVTGVSGFDAASYLRTTGSPNCGSLSNTNAAATRIAIGIAWGGGTLANVSGYTDQGSGTQFGGVDTCRVSSLVESSVNSRTSAFGAGTGANPFHCTQFIFNDVTAGGGITALNLYQPAKVTLRM